MAPLNWGLGHATRCIPIINALQDSGFTPLIASDGSSLDLLKKEFPLLETIELPSYKIEYAKKGRHFKLKMIKDSPKMFKAINKERKQIGKLVRQGQIQGIISDNRFGVRSKKVPSVFITHQLNVLTGNTTWLSSKMHRRFIKKFDECWVPDVEGTPNLSGKLGHIKKPLPNLKYIGPLSRLGTPETIDYYDLLVILSGPEPQRTMLENKLFEEVKDFNGKVLFIRGKVEEKQEQFDFLNCRVFNFMTSKELEIAFGQSAMVLCRSGYTTMMDLAKVNKKAFLIPTPGQYEQEYLAKYYKKMGVAPCCNQKKFSIDKLEKVDGYPGFGGFYKETDLSDLFGLFERK
ncbi:glycosyltransferase [Sungkyunkwania multivorans]|uniref:Glycosyltransferase n=1 Tax=Sungkyunkwania multivorans TaxID=1173618 RepID=A0ABW3CUZ2_9FLAO